jgi:hypothetical protein
VSCPGGLREWDGAERDWSERVALVAGRIGLPQQLAIADASNATELRMPDWPAVPARIRACLGRERADRLLDARDTSNVGTGRVAFQEEYAEWRLVMDDGGPVRFELTTELADYWELLARHNPAKVIELIGDFAREDVDPSAVFGSHDPFGKTSTEEARGDAFLETMLGRSSVGEDPTKPGPYNNGAKAITCLLRTDNTLRALINLVVAAAATPQLIVDAESREGRCPSGSEAISVLEENSAQDCRNSDPVVVERIVRLATEGRLIRFDDPIGIYIVDVQTAELVGPRGEGIPREWWNLGRQEPGVDGLPRFQRLALEIPEEAGFDLWQVRSRRTGHTIARGAELAELVQLGVYVRVSEREQLQIDIPQRPARPVVRCHDQLACALLRELAQEVEGAVS